jgi:hypothetical protein
MLFVLGGALVNASYLGSGADYAGFADTAHFAWVANASRLVRIGQRPSSTHR